MSIRILSLPLVCCIFAAGCSSLPKLEVATTEPIKVDINMRLDVYQHGAPVKVTDPAPVQDSVALQTRRRNRLGEVQVLKNARVIGENRLGMLELRSADLPDDYARYIRSVVDAENADREAIMQRIAKDQALPLDKVRERQAELWRERSFEGEWIEAPREGGYVWTQKKTG